MMLAILLALQPEPAYEDHLRLGWEWLRVTGSTGVEIWHDDNVLLSRENEESDIVTALVPKLHLRAGGERLGGSVDYSGRARFFLDNRRFNGMEHVVEAAGHGGIGPLRVEAYDRFQSRNDPFSTVARTDRIDWLQNDAGLAITAALGRVRAELSGEHRFIELQDDAFEFFDHRRWQASVLGGWEFTARVEAIAEAGAGHTEYRDHRDLIDDYGFLWYAGGIRGFLRENIQVLVKAGAFRARVDESSGAAPAKSDGGLYVAGALTWQPSDDGELKLEFQRRPIESIVSGWTLATRVEVAYTHQLLLNLTVGAGAFWEDLDESPHLEDRRASGWHVWATYSFSRHFSVTVRGETRRKDSDDHRFEYDNRRGSIGVTVSW